MLTLEVTWICKGTRITKTDSKKNRYRTYLISRLKYKATKVKAVWYWFKDVQINSLGKRVWKETFTYMVNLLSNMLKQVNEEGIVSLVLLQLVYRYMQKKTNNILPHTT